MVGNAAQTLLSDVDRLVLFVGLVGWLTIDNVRTLRFRNSVVGTGAAIAVLDLIVLHPDLLGECLASAVGVFAILLIVELAWDAPLGMGTVKASMLIALFLGYMSWMAVVIGALIAGATWVARRRRDPWNRAGVAAGPGMLAASCLTILIAQI